MSEQIKVGDLVVVTWSHCVGAEADELGVIRTVLSLDSGKAYWLKCRQCGSFYKSPPIAEVEKDGWHPLSWLKRIPPLSELDDAKRDAEITA